MLPPAEAAAIYVKREAAARKQLPKELIGVWFISPCPSKETNIRQSVDVHHTELTGSFSLSEIYGLLLKNLGGTHELNVRTGSSYGMAGEPMAAKLKAPELPTVWQFTALIMCMTCWSSFHE